MKDAADPLALIGGPFDGELVISRYDRISRTDMDEKGRKRTAIYVRRRALKLLLIEGGNLVAREFERFVWEGCRL